MKKISLFFLIVNIIFVISGCSSKKCDICNGTGAENEVQAVTTWYLCDSCYYNFLTDDYNNVGYSQDNSNNRCLDCGKSIDYDRLYCDACLGYGVCQDCGRNIDSDRLYCDTCLYN